MLSCHLVSFSDDFLLFVFVAAPPAPRTATLSMIFSDTNSSAFLSITNQSTEQNLVYYNKVNVKVDVPRGEKQFFEPETFSIPITSTTDKVELQLRNIGIGKHQVHVSLAAEGGASNYTTKEFQRGRHRLTIL